MRTYLLAAFWTILGTLGALAWFAGHHWGGLVFVASMACAKNAMCPARPGADDRESSAISVGWDIDL